MTDDTYAPSSLYNQINHKFLSEAELKKLHRIEQQYHILLEKKIYINLHEYIDYVQMEIVDLGKGITKEVLNKIGEPFYTTKAKGTGIGLMICFQIIESHQGTIQVTSEVDVGTTFTIELPKVPLASNEV